jgi:hypothetical protein
MCKSVSLFLCSRRITLCLQLIHLDFFFCLPYFHCNPVYGYLQGIFLLVLMAAVHLLVCVETTGLWFACKYPSLQVWLIFHGLRRCEIVVRANIC